MGEKCVYGHDRCDGSPVDGCPYCEREDPPRNNLGRFIAFKPRLVLTPYQKRLLREQRRAALTKDPAHE